MVDLTGYRLTFDEEFNKRSISQTGAGTTWADIRSQWRFDANSDIGFGHSSFVDPASGYDPFSVRNGTLTITAVPDRTGFGYPGSWESGLITTQGNFSQTYGYFEMRANLSSGIGAWDAFWLLPNQPASNPNRLPGWQELDIVEHYGSKEAGVYSALHTTDNTPSRNLQYYSSHPGLTSGYHTYAVNWQPDKISFYFDGTYMGYQLTPSDMHGPMYILADLATQASGGNNADIANSPLSMSIDYIRAYSNSPGAVAVVHDTVSAPDHADPGLYGATSAAVPSAPTPTSVPQTGASTGAPQPTGSASTSPGPSAASDSSPVTGGGAGNKPEIGFTVDLQGSVAQAYRLYQAALDRTPDGPGLTAHASALQHGLSLHDDAMSFITSPEFALKFGTDTTDQAFVSALYDNVLDRAPDATGNANWLNALTSHTLDRASVLIGFSESLENHAKVNPTIASGLHLDYGIFA